MKKIAMLLVFVLMLTSIAACGGGGGSDSSTPDNTAGSEDAGAVDAGEQDSAAGGSDAVNKTGYPIMNEDHTFRIAHVVASTDKIGSWENKEFTKKIEEETGLNIEWIGIPESSYNDQVGIMIAANDLPDAFIGVVPSFEQFIDSFVPLNDLINEYAPSLVEFYDTYPDIMLAGVFPDGSIYGMPYMQANNMRAARSLSVNTEWLEKLNLEAPNNTDELFDVLMAFKTEDPNGNGLDDEIPFGFYKDKHSYGFEMIMNAFGIYGGAEDDYPYLMVEDGQVVFYPETQNYYDYLEYMNKLYTNGLLDPSGFVQEENDLNAKGKSGTLGMYQNGSYDDIRVGDLADQYDFVLPLENAQGERNYFPTRYSGDVIQNKFTITTVCEYPEAMVRLYDYMNESLENRLTFGWGQEDVAWKWNEDGTITRLNNEEDLPEAYDSYAEVRHTLSMGVMSAFLWNDEDQALFTLAGERDVKYYSRSDAYMEHAVDEYIPIGQDTVENSQAISVLLTELYTYMDNFEAECIMSGIDEAKWETHLNSVKQFRSEEYVGMRQSYYESLLERMSALEE